VTISPESPSPTFDRSDIETARAVFEKLYPADESRHRILEILADDIETAHAVNPASWSVTLGTDGRSALLNVGRVFALHFATGTVSVILSEGVMDLPVGLHGDFPEERARRFVTLPDVAWFRFPVDELLTQWEALREDHRRCVERAAETARRTPYARSYSAGLTRLAEEATGNRLPLPAHQDAGDAGGDLATSLVDLVRRSFPGWSGFGDPRFVEDELSYKRAAATKIQELLAEGTLRDLIERGRHAEVIARVKKAGQATNLLYLGTPSTGDLALLHADALDPAELSLALLDLLYGEGDSPNRIERFSA
jgi:hypothetical protein